MPIFVRGQKAKLADLTSSTTLTVGLAISDPGRRTFDVACFGLDAHDQLSDDRYMVFFNQTQSPCGGLAITAATAGDLQTFAVQLDRLPAAICKLVFTVTLDGGGSMAQIASGYFRLAAGNQEVMRFDFRGSDFGQEKAIMAAEIYRKDIWRLAAVGQGFAGGLPELLRHFGGVEADAPAPSPAPSPFGPPPVPPRGGSSFPPPLRPPSGSPVQAPPRLSLSSSGGSRMPVFTVQGDIDPFLQVHLERGEKIYAESDAMVTMDTTLELKGKLQGGLVSALARKFANDESLFMQTIEATQGPGNCLLAPALPGSLGILDCGQRQYFLNDGAFVAATDGVDIKVKTQGIGKAFLGGTGGFFIMQTSGQGQLVVAGFGGLVEIEVTQELIVDNYHVVAWDSSLNYELSMSTSKNSGFLSNLINSATSGEGIVNRFSGRGKIYICSRNRGGFISWLASKISPGSGG